MNKTKQKIDYSIILSILATIISSYSIYLSKNLHSDNSSSQIIRENYKDFLDLHLIRAEYPLYSHIFVNRYKYLETKNLIKGAVKLKTKEERIEMQLVESALARRVFTMYEHSYYQWQNSVRFSEESRIKFLKLVLDHFTNVLLKNPRLVWYWSENGGDFNKYYEKEVVEYYNSHVLKKRSDLLSDAFNPYN